MRFILNGKRWNFTRKSDLGRAPNGDKYWGRCDPPDARNKSVQVLASLKGEDELDTIIHEVIHAAAWPVLDEDFVNDTASDLARLLWRLGYRRIPQ